MPRCYPGGYAMEVPHDAVLLRIFTSVADRWKMGPLTSASLKRHAS